MKDNVVSLEQRAAAPQHAKLAAIRQAWTRGDRGSSQTEKHLIPRRTSGAPIPLSFSQQRLWFVEQLHPGSPLYNLQLSFIIEGALNVRALAHALADIARRHEIFRAAIQVSAGEPLLQISEPKPVMLPVTPIAEADGELSDSKIAALVQQRLAAPFDMVRGPLFHAELLRLGASRHVLVLLVHHIIWDQWSNGLFCRELSLLYDAQLSGKRATLPELPLQFADYSTWQHIRSEEFEPGIAWFEKALENTPRPVCIPSDHVRPPGFTCRGARVPALLSDSFVERLETFSRTQNATSFMTAMAALNVLLYRYTGQEDLVVGTVAANRLQAEVEPLLGFFVNTIALRTRVRAHETFRQLLARVRDFSMQTMQYQETPFEKVIARLQPGRDVSQNPLFRSMLVVQNTPDAELSLSGLQVRRLDVEEIATVADLTFFLERANASWRLLLVYNTDLFERATAQRVLDQFQTLLGAAIANPDTAISSLPVSSQAELHCLHAWNDTAAEFPRDACVQQLFEQIAARYPRKEAIRWDSESISYLELNRRANYVARQLREAGVLPGDITGLLLERSPELIVAALGALKAGAAYMPLDPAYPSQRLAFMIAEAHASVVVTNTRFQACVPDRAAAIVMHEDGSCEQNPAARTLAAQPACVMFTSGSSGRPKGILIPHRAITRLVCNSNHCSFGPQDAVAQFSNSSFDASLFEIWGPLLNGARVVGVRKDVALAASELKRHIERTGITTLFLTTALFHQLAAEDPAAFGALRNLVVGGEILDPARCDAVLRAAPPQRLVNGYGPTESTTFASYEVVTATHESQPVPIGRPLSNTKIYILDRDGGLAPSGAAGELCIGGDGLALGYLGRPELSAEKFVPDPFSGIPGARLYRTADLARFRSDGRIDFLGRTDRQAKIRGFRIEPGEIETVLAAHSDMRQVAVVVRGERDDKRLIGYFCAVNALDTAELDRWLRERLPRHMIPQTLVRLERMPLTATGKIDRDQLPDAGVVHSSQHGSTTPPRDAVEEAIAAIWSTSLHVEHVGVEDDFFSLGGHSLLAMRMMTQVRELFQVEAPLRAFFENPTIRGLAEAISRYHSRPADVQEIARIWKQLSALPDGDVARLAAEQALHSPAEQRR